MRAMAFASSELAALARTTVSSPRFFQITPTCPPAAVLALWRHPRVAPTAREVHHHGQRSAAPALQATRTALVLLDQQPPCQLVLFRVFGLAGATAIMLPRYADLHIRIAAEVLHPVRAVASSREHVEGASLGYEGEPDLDLVRPSRQPPCRRQVAEVLFCEVTKITHRHQVCMKGSASRNLSLTPVAFIPVAIRRVGSCRSSSWGARL